MSKFSTKVKNELARIKIAETECAVAELAAFTRICSNLKFKGGGEIGLTYVTENAAIARRIFSLLKRYYVEDVNVYVTKNVQLKRNNTYLISAEDSGAVRTLLYDIGFVINDNFFNPDYNVGGNIIRNSDCKRSYIRASFLGGGSISNPERAYHIEFVTNAELHAVSLVNVLDSEGIKAKFTPRKDKFVVYIKGSEFISELLIMMGANNAFFDFEDVRLKKDLRNNVNRVVNCETANLEKTVNASLRQIADIDFIDGEIGLNSLDDSLRELAVIRKKNPDMSLKDIGNQLNPPLGKSGVNHRLNKISKIANDLRGGKQ